MTSKDFTQWCSKDLLDWINKEQLPPAAKNTIKEAIQQYDVNGDQILTCEDDSELQEILDIKSIYAKQLMGKLKTCEAYNNSKNGQIIEGTPFNNNNNNNKNNNDKKQEEEIKKKAQEMKKKEEEIKKIQDKQKQEEEIKKKQQQEKAKNSKSAFDANKMINNNKIKENNIDEFYPTFALQLGKQFTEKDKMISPNMTVSDLKIFIRDRYLGDGKNKLTHLDLYFSGKLLDDDQKPIKYYNIISSRCVIMTQTKLRGGAQISSNEKIRKININDPLLTITSNVDCITYEDSDDEPRALMPCGHSFTAITMYTYILHSFANDFTHSEFYCPIKNCFSKWAWSLVSTIADLTDEEFEKYSNLISQNQLKKGEIKICPHCQICVDKPEQINRNRVHCESCNGNDFCYSCLKIWKNSGLQICGNEECETHTIQQNITNCGEIKNPNWSDQIIPFMRACPNCLSIITYHEACKHMKCAVKECNYEFCFSCLQKWPCQNGVGNSKACPPAPRQKL